jgi:hypothetical protein
MFDVCFDRRYVVCSLGRVVRFNPFVRYLLVIMQTRSTYAAVPLCTHEDGDPFPSRRP